MTIQLMVKFFCPIKKGKNGSFDINLFKCKRTLNWTNINYIQKM